MTTWLEYESAAPREQDSIAMRWYMIGHDFNHPHWEQALTLWIKHRDRRSPLRYPSKRRSLDWDIENGNFRNLYDPIYPNVESGR